MSFQDTDGEDSGNTFNVRKIIEEAFLNRNVPAETAKILLSSLAPNTLKQYYSSLRAWKSFCIQNPDFSYKNPTKLSTLIFLTQRFNNGASYATLNTDRSAISLISVEKIGDDLEIARFFKGVYRLRPIKSRYVFTWDTNIVLNYLKKLDLNDHNYFSLLSKKLVMLLALGTAQRAQILSIIKITNIKFDVGGVTIVIDDLIKTSARNKSQPILKFQYFSQEKNLCIASCLFDYINFTKNIRENENKLFLSLNKSHKAISSQTISRWLKEVLQASGINIELFKGHSTRSAATSKANNLGVSIDLIRKTAGWTSGSLTFAKFYNKPISDESDGNFVSAVFNIEK